MDRLRLSNGFQRSNVNRSGVNERVNAALPSEYAVAGKFLVDGTGEAVKSVNFPVRFLDRPHFDSDAELHLDSPPVSGNFPTHSVTINTWIIEQVVGFTKQYYRGANLLIVTTGATGQRLWIHWRISGKAMLNPSDATGASSNSPI